MTTSDLVTAIEAVEVLSEIGIIDDLAEARAPEGVHCYSGLLADRPLITISLLDAGEDTLFDVPFIIEVCADVNLSLRVAGVALETADLDGTGSEGPGLEPGDGVEPGVVASEGEIASGSVPVDTVATGPATGPGPVTGPGSSTGPADPADADRWSRLAAEITFFNDEDWSVRFPAGPDGAALNTVVYFEGDEVSYVDDLAEAQAISEAFPTHDGV